MNAADSRALAMAEVEALVAEDAVVAPTKVKGEAEPDAWALAPGKRECRPGPLLRDESEKR